MAKEQHAGNPIAANATYVKELVSLAENLMRLDRLVTQAMAEGAEWGNMTLRPPGVEGGEWMAIVRATMNQERYVAFVTASSLHELLRLVAAKALNDSLKWKADTFR